MDGFLHILKTEPKAVNFLLQLKFAVRKYKDARVVPLLRALLADRYLAGITRWEAEQVLRELGEKADNR